MTALEQHQRVALEQFLVRSGWDESDAARLVDGADREAIRKTIDAMLADLGADMKEVDDILKTSRTHLENMESIARDGQAKIKTLTALREAISRQEQADA